MDQTQIELHCWNAGGVEHYLDAAWIAEGSPKGLVLELHLSPFTTVHREVTFLYINLKRETI